MHGLVTQLKTAMTFVALLGAFCLFAGDVFGDDEELHRLRKTGDPKRLEDHCREMLRGDRLSADQRAELVGELAAAIAQQANAAAQPQEGERLWAEADKVLAGFLLSHADHPRAALLLRQRLIYAYTHGEGLRRHAEVFPDDQVLPRARRILEAAEGHGRALEAIVQKQLDAYKEKTPAVAFDQLLGLSNDTPFRLAHVRLGLAQAFPEKDPERGRWLSESARSFEFYTREGFSPNEQCVRAYLGLGECRRLQGRFDDAVKLLMPIVQSAAVPAGPKDEAMTTHMNVLLDQDQPQAAKGLLKGRTRLSPEMALAHIRATLLEAAQAARRGDAAGAARLQAVALDRVEVGEREFAPGWGLRVGALLARHAKSAWLADDLGQAVRLAESFARSGVATEASAAYRRAADLARAAGRREQAVEWAEKGAKALAQAGRGAEAADEFLRLLQEDPRGPKAARLSLLAAHALRRAWQQNGKPEALERLRKHLAEHLQHFPVDDASAEARLLAGLAESAADSQRLALEHFARVPVEHPLFAAALEHSIRTLDSIRKSSPEEGERLTREWLPRLDAAEKSLTPAQGEVGVRWQIGVARAELLCRPLATLDELRLARRTADALLRQSNLDAGVRQRATAARLLACIGLNDQKEIAAVVATLPADALRPLHLKLRDWPAAERTPALAAARLAVIRRLLLENVSESERHELRRGEAKALADLGRLTEAREAYAALRAEMASDPGLMEEHARVLIRLGGREDSTLAVKLWQAIAALRKEGEPDWLEAKYQLAVALQRLGEAERARKILRVTHELWLKDASGDPVRRPFQQRYQELERQLR